MVGVGLLMAFAVLGVVALWSALGDDEPDRAAKPRTPAKSGTVAKATPTAKPSPSPSPAPTPAAPAPEAELEAQSGANGSTARARVESSSDRAKVFIDVACAQRVARCEVGLSRDGRRITRPMGNTKRGQSEVHDTAVPAERLSALPYAMVVKRYRTRGQIARRVILRTRIDRLVDEGASG